MASLDFESDPFLQLLTDALRAGPGSPQWRQAVESLRKDGGGGAAGAGGDEYRLLLEARENLESGKEYRSVRAGPAFTHKVLSAVEQEEADGATGVSTALIIAIAAGVVGCVIVASIAYFLFSGGKPKGPTLADLENQTFARAALAAPLDAGVPAGWKTAGPVEIRFDGTARPVAPAPDATTAPSDYVGGALYAAVPFAAGEPLAVEVTFALDRPGEAVIPQVFVTDDPDFSSDKATSPHELAWTVKKVDGRVEPQVVLPDGTFVGHGDDINAHGRSYTVRLALGGEFVTVDADGKRVYAGPNGLSADKPRTVGVRFLRRADAKNNRTAVEAVRVLKP